MNIVLSIIIPMYNAQKTIIKCIDSIENQITDFQFEIIIVDDGSTDNSVAILEDCRLKYDNIFLLRQKNLKQSVARNNGLGHAKGKYVMFFDCDDIIEPNMLNKMINIMQKGNDFTMCGIRKIFDNDEVIIENKTRLSKSKDKKQLISDYLTKNKELDTGLWNKVFKLKIIKENNLFFDNGDFFEDSLFVFKYLYFCNFNKIEIIENTFYNLFKRNGKSTTTVFNSKIDFWADQYISKVESFFEDYSFDISQNALSSFEARVKLHVVHHHIKYDPLWNANIQRKKLSFLNFNSILRTSSYLDMNYWMACVIARYFPNIYMLLYLKNIDH